MRGKRMFLLVGVLGLCSLVSLAAGAFAQGEHSQQANPTQGQQAGIKEGPVSDRQQLKEQHKPEGNGAASNSRSHKGYNPRYLERREDLRDRREDFRDRKEDIRSRREDIKDRRKDSRDRREDVKDRPQHKQDMPGHEFKKRHDMQPRENIQHQQPEHDRGVRDHGAGVGAGRGQGGAHRAGGPGPRGGGGGGKR